MNNLDVTVLLYKDGVLVNQGGGRRRPKGATAVLGKALLGRMLLGRK